MIKLGSNIESKTVFGLTALCWAAKRGNEGCLRALVSAGACLKVKDNRGKTPLDYALENLCRQGNNKNKRIVELLKGETVISMEEIRVDPRKQKYDEIAKAAIEGNLARFFDVQDVPRSLVSEVLSMKVTVASIENLLQTLWFGGSVEHKDINNCTPLL